MSENGIKVYGQDVYRDGKRLWTYQEAMKWVYETEEYLLDNPAYYAVQRAARLREIEK